MRGIRPDGSDWRRAVRYGAAFLTLAAVGGALFVWSGIYDVAASNHHWQITNWLLERVRVESVETRSHFVDAPPPLDDPDLVRLGAAHFEGGCTPCHSRPGDPANAIAAAMLPAPPPLSGSVTDLEAEEIFWIVKHGLKFTAMPAWPSLERDDEVWAVTAFLVRLPSLSQEQYLERAGVRRAGDEQKSDAELARSSESVGLTECVRCHGDASMPPVSDLVPLLNVQSQPYLERALSEYAKSTRQSGIMQPVATVLRPGERRRLAAWYASLDAPPMPSTRAASNIEHGRKLAEEGDAERGLPPCLACHSRQHPEPFPALAGLSAAYLETQLRVFRGGARERTVYGEIMTVVARRLTRQQIESAAAYFASLPPGAEPSYAGPVR